MPSSSLSEKSSMQHLFSEMVSVVEAFIVRTVIFGIKVVNRLCSSGADYHGDGGDPEKVVVNHLCSSGADYHGDGGDPEKVVVNHLCSSGAICL